MREHRIRLRVRTALQICLCMAMVTLIAWIGAVMASAEIYSGECGEQGDNVTWTLDTESGTLLIAGEGYTEGYSQYVNPSWSPYWDSIKEVKVSSGILNVGHWLFYGCKNLERVGLPESVTQIEFSAFSGCSSLREVNIPDGVTVIERSVFYGCSSLETIQIPYGVTEIRSSAFACCRNLRSIDIPDTVTEIQIHAFSGCNDLQEITLSDHLAVMGDYALSACYKLSEITLPTALVRIGDHAFMGCDGLTDVYYDGSLTKWKSISVGTDNECLLEAALHLKTAESQGLVFTSYGDGTCYISGRGTCRDADLIIPAFSPSGDRVTRIKNETFASCAWLTSVTIPEGVTSIGEGAFRNCQNLTGISIPDSMKTISQNVFTGCNQLFQIENGIKYVDGWAVGYVKGLTVADLREGTKGIAECAFVRCDTMTRLSIPESIQRIGTYAFSGCTALESIRYNARELQHIFSDNNYVFYDAGKNGRGIEVVFGACVEVVPARIFSPVHSYGADYSAHMPKIVSVVFEEGSACKTMQFGAFWGCRTLTTVVLPEGLTVLDGSVFSGCVNLTGLRIPASVTHIFNTSSLDFGMIVENVNGIHYVDRWVVGKDAGITSAVIRPGTVGIGDSAFEGECEGLVSVMIPVSVAHIGEWAFYDHYWSITDAYYAGTETEWREIDRGLFQLSLAAADLHFLGDLYDITAASLTLGESLTMNYYAKADPAYGTPRMRFTFRGTTFTEDGVYDEASGEYVFSLIGIAPQCMGENIKAELILVWEDGTELTMDVKGSYSIRAYCDDALASDPRNEALATLLADLLAYGAAAQDYTGFNADTPVSEDFAASPSEWEDVTNTDLTLSEKTREDIRFTAAGVRFGYVNSIYFKIKAADLAGVTVTVGDKTYAVQDLTLTEDADGTYILYTDPICATQLDKLVTAELAVDGEVIQTVTYSVRSYVYAKQNTENDKMAALAKALYSYGRSAIAYKNAR